MGSSDYDQYPPELSDFLKKSRIVHEKNIETAVKVVGVIGKDYPDHSKGEGINLYLKDNVFQTATDAKSVLTIRAHFSEEHQILFLLMNGIDDTENLKKVFRNDSQKSFFEKLAESEELQGKMLHFLFISCHFIIIFEQTSRIDLEFFRTLKEVNNMRIESKHEIDKFMSEKDYKHLFFITRQFFSNERAGRATIPRLLMVFQRNNVRTDLGANRKREIYEKLEKSIDKQVADLLKSYQLIDNPDSLCQLNETLPFVHLMNPNILQRDVVEEILETFLQNPEDRKFPQSSSSNSYTKFLDENFKSEKNVVSLGDTIKILDCFASYIFKERKNENEEESGHLYLNFERMIFKDHVQEAFRKYENDSKPTASHNRRDIPPLIPSLKVERENVRTKAEHDARFAEAVRYLNTVLSSNLQKGLDELQQRCDKIWQSDLRACEQLSLTGARCTRKVHPTFGDLTCSEYKWTPHESHETIISTCACGSHQIIRSDPFTLKEANFDFFDNNPDFRCCSRLERYQFQVYREDSDEKEEWSAWSDRESNSLLGRDIRKIRVLEVDCDDEDTEDAYDAAESPSLHEKADNSSMESSTGSIDSNYHYTRPRSRQNSLSQKIDEKSVEFAKRLINLRKAGKEHEFIEGVPNSLTSGRLPLFSSWILTCLGDSSLYNHSSGVKHQPNFKIGGEFLIPALVLIDCHVDVWNREIDRMRSEDFTRRNINRPKSNDEFAKVKLFVGFEYECSRGHRFFVDHRADPLLYPKGSHVSNETTRRPSLNNILNVDLPIRRPCTCRKAPLQSSQLMKIHIVTPKAPVTITIDPKVEIPGHEGVYNTGQAPLELQHSKYYILQLPMIYSGPSGTYIHKRTNLEKAGTWKGNAINIVHKPMFTFRW